MKATTNPAGQGKARSEKKTAACRRNARLGGRPPVLRMVITNDIEGDWQTFWIGRKQVFPEIVAMSPTGGRVRLDHRTFDLGPSQLPKAGLYLFQMVKNTIPKDLEVQHLAVGMVAAKPVISVSPVMPTPPDPNHPELFTGDDREEYEMDDLIRVYGHTSEEFNEYCLLTNPNVHVNKKYACYKRLMEAAGEKPHTHIITY